MVLDIIVAPHITLSYDSYLMLILALSSPLLFLDKDVLFSRLLALLFLFRCEARRGGTPCDF